jgi:hypothetical protein
MIRSNFILAHCTATGRTMAPRQRIDSLRTHIALRSREGAAQVDIKI